MRAMTLLVATSLLLFLSYAKFSGATASQSPMVTGGVVPGGLAREARWVALHGGVLGSCHGCATPRMRALARRLIVARFGAGSPAVCIVEHESGFNPGAISSTGDYGLPQMNRLSHEDEHPEWWRPARGFRYLIFDPVFAAGAMWAMSRRGTDWSAWTGTWGRGMC